MNENFTIIKMNDNFDMTSDDLYFENESISFIDLDDCTDLKKIKNSKKADNNKTKPKASKKGKEASYIKKVLSDFDYKSSLTWKKIQHMFSTGIRHTELLSVAEVLVHLTGAPNISRSCHRSFPVLIKWFDDNWEILEPIIYRISLLDENKNKIDFSREMNDHIRVK